MKELTYTEIPQAILDELNAHYTDVRFDLDSNLSNVTQSFKSSYTFCKEGDLQKTAMLVEDLEKAISVMGKPQTSFIVRADVYDTLIIVRRVIEIDSLVPSETLH